MSQAMARPTPPAPHAATAAAVRSVVIDGHAHFYPAFRLERFLTAAARNLSRITEPGDPDPVHALVVAERRGAPCLTSLHRADAEGAAGSWTITSTDEPGSLVARHPSGQSLVLIAARQVVTAEGLEVLAVPTDKPLADGRPLRATLESVLAADATPILPWGVGKWWGSRGESVCDILRSELSGSIGLGDISSRPLYTPLPRQIRLAAAAQVPVLAGTDPLPVRHHAALAGSYASCLYGAFDEGRPAASIRRLLRQRPLPPTRGRRCGWLGVLRSQVALRRARDGAEARP